MNKGLGLVLIIVVLFAMVLLSDPFVEKESVFSDVEIIESNETHMVQNDSGSYVLYLNMSDIKEVE